MKFSNPLNPMIFKDNFKDNWNCAEKSESPIIFKEIFERNEIDIEFEKKLKEYINFIVDMREREALDILQNMKYTILKDRIPFILENLADNN